jgi:hypothetical protein
MADELGLREMKESPFTENSSAARVVVPAGNKHERQMVYKRSNVSRLQVEDDCCCMMGNWVMIEGQNTAEIRGNKPRGLSCIE